MCKLGILNSYICETISISNAVQHKFFILIWVIIFIKGKNLGASSCMVCLASNKYVSRGNFVFVFLIFFNKKDRDYVIRCSLITL